MDKVIEIDEWADEIEAKAALRGDPFEDFDEDEYDRLEDAELERMWAE